MIALQALDYRIWAEAHIDELAELLGAEADREPGMDLVVVRPEGRRALDNYTRAVLERLDRSVPWRAFEAAGDLDGKLHLEQITVGRVRTGHRWVHRAHSRVATGAAHYG